MPSSFGLSYRKTKNEDLFKDVNELPSIKLRKGQNYYPLLSRFFEMKKNNFSDVTLNNKHNLARILKATDRPNVFKCVVRSQSNGGDDEKENILNSFIKFAPLIDPIHHMTRSHNTDGYEYVLPNLGKDSDVERLNITENASYVDNFFYYLSSSLMQVCCFPHATEYYGSVIGLMERFEYNVGPDLPYLIDSPYFHKNNSRLFELDNYVNEIIPRRSGFMKRITIHPEVLDNVEVPHVTAPIETTNSSQIVVVDDLSPLGTIVTNDINNESECSSRESDTGEDDDDDIEDMTIDSEGSSEDDESFPSIASLFSFPTQLISLENLEGTLDSHLEKTESTITDEELASIAIQTIMALLAYERAFDFTHNDLHTNNIMYQSTEKQYIYYRYQSQYYRVPTFGKIYKIIDFGRSIYKFKGEQLCSDSYAPWGDACSLYNFGKYKDDTKKEILPNKSFDLCRLGCSMFEYINTGDLNPPTHKDCSARAMILRWVLDDEGKNMLFKSNGVERYPEFKLYKMIARKVHSHSPELVIKDKAFDRFKTIKRNLPSNRYLVCIDKIPVLT